MGLFGKNEVRAEAQLESRAVSSSSAAAGSTQAATRGSDKSAGRTRQNHADTASQSGSKVSHSVGPDLQPQKNVKYRSDPQTYVFEDGPMEGRMDIRRCGPFPPTCHTCMTSHPRHPLPPSPATQSPHKCPRLHRCTETEPWAQGERSGVARRHSTGRSAHLSGCLRRAAQPARRDGEDC